MSKTSDSTPRIPITIAGREFTCPQPYSSGHVLTEGEAEVLNAVFAERVKTNCARTVRDYLNYSDTPMEDMQKTIDYYADRYEFSSRPDPIRAKAIELAKKHLSEQLGPDAAYDAEEYVIRFPQFLIAARKIIEAQRALAESTLSEQLK